ncbi:MAG: MFS transporter [Betaproteobacteria bacterium]|jgi:MFS family permease
MKIRKISASHGVLAMLCLMYFIAYVDRVNVSTAAVAFKQELGLSNTQVGLVFSAFAYPYLVFQVIGGWFGDRFGARRTLFICGIVWAAATILTGFSGGLASLLAARVLLGLGEGATFPAATRAMSHWTTASQRGFAQGITHAFARIGNAVTPPIVAWLMVVMTWRGSFFLLGVASLVWTLAWVFYFRDDPKDHPGITPRELQILPAYSGGKARRPVPWSRLVRRMAPVTLVYFCYGWTLWLFLSWIPLYFLQRHGMDLKHSALFASGVFFAGVVGDTVGGMASDWLLQRTGSRSVARRNLVVFGMLGAMLSLLPMLFTPDFTVAVVCLSLGFFFAELTIGPMWAIPMDIAPQFSGTAAGLMNVGSAFAAIVSPVVAGWIIDTTGDWNLPFVGSMGLMLLGAVMAFAMKPDQPFEKPEQG